MKELQILAPDGTSRMIRLEGRRIILGRSSTADLTFPNDNGLSRQHLAIEYDGGGWSVSDLGSKNGTVLNGVKVAARTALKSGDRIRVGSSVLCFRERARRQ